MRQRLRRAVVTGEECVLAIQGNRPGEVFDPVAADLDSPVGEEDLESVPVTGDIGELLAEAGLGRDTGALLEKVIPPGSTNGRMSVNRHRLRSTPRPSRGLLDPFAEIVHPV